MEETKVVSLQLFANVFATLRAIFYLFIFLIIIIFDVSCFQLQRLSELDLRRRVQVTHFQISFPRAWLRLGLSQKHVSGNERRLSVWIVRSGLILHLWR